MTCAPAQPSALVVVSPASAPVVGSILGELGYSPIVITDPGDALRTFTEMNHELTVFELRPGTDDFIDKLKLIDLNFATLVITSEKTAELFLDLMRYPRMLAVCQPFDGRLFAKAVERLLNLPCASENARRSSLRMSVNLPVDIGPLGSGRLTNLSLGGVFIQCERKPGLEDRVFVQFPLSTATNIVAEAKVVRVEPNGFGAAFVAITEEDRHALRSFLILELDRTQPYWLVSE